MIKLPELDKYISTPFGGAFCFNLSTPYPFLPKRGGLMPNKPKRPCSHHGCPQLTDGRFCEEHARQEAKRYERYQRDPATRKRYGSAWRKVRDSYRAAHPLCENCLAQGRFTPTQEVHHVKPLAQGGTNDYDNLRALCTPCHSEITAREGGRWGR